MDLTLTEIQNLLQNSTREFMDAEMPKSRVLEIDDSESGFASDIWQQIAELGYAGMVIPEEYGGSGNSFTDMGVVYEIMGYYACPSPHHSSAVLAAQAILEAGSSAQKEAMLPAIASGQQIFAFAYTEPDYGWGPGVVQLPATRRNGAYVLNGAKLFIPDANVCDQMIVVAPHQRGLRRRGHQHVRGGHQLARRVRARPDRMDRPQGVRGELRQRGGARLERPGSELARHGPRLRPRATGARR